MTAQPMPAEPTPIAEVMVPLTDVLAEPCKGCGKRPIDFFTGTSDEYIAAKSNAELRSQLTAANARAEAAENTIKRARAYCIDDRGAMNVLDAAIDAMVKP